jgi:hypothetical protein
MGEENAGAYKRVITEALKMDFEDGAEGAVECRIVNGLNQPRLLYHAMATPILSGSELGALGFTPDRVREVVKGFQGNSNHDLLGLPEGRYSESNYPRWGDNGSHEFKEIRVEDFAFRLWILKSMGCLDLVDQEDLVRRIVSLQITDKFRLPGEFSPVDINQASGLFHLGHCSLGETWAALWILEMLGKLDQIDREACIQGLLRLHRGKGVFMAYSPTETDKQIVGDEDETFYALESLTRLNALDRIPDFQKWKFHPVTHNVTQQVKEGRLQTSPGHVTDATLRSWAYQERLERLQHKEM